MPIKTEHYTAPSYWASGLINGDWSGLEPDERDAAQAWADTLPGAIVSCEDAGFLRWHDAFRQMSLAADCQTYTVHVVRAIR